LLTGVYPEAHGITGNKYWDRSPGSAVAPLEAASAIEAETIFTVAESEAPALRTVAAFGKAKLGRLFDTVSGRQHAPDVLWAPGYSKSSLLRLAMLGSTADDEAVMDAVVAALEPEPDLTVVGLSTLDITCHQNGVGSIRTGEALGKADSQIERLVGELRRRGRWERSIVVVTGDHGFADVRPAPGTDRLYLSFGHALRDARLTGLRVASDGGVAHVYAEGVSDGSVFDAATVARLAAARELALRTPGVAEALYRLPAGPDTDAAVLAVARPTWRIAHPHAGDLVLIAQPSVMFGDPPEGRESKMVANHGGPGELAVPLVFCGGAAALRRDVTVLNGIPSLADAGATLFAWLGLRASRRLDESPVAVAARGRPIAAVMAP
jgi:hypothetical protein